MTIPTLAPAPALLDDDFAPLDVKVVLATHPFGKLQCATGFRCCITETALQDKLRFHAGEERRQIPRALAPDPAPWRACLG